MNRLYFTVAIVCAYLTLGVTASLTQTAGRTGELTPGVGNVEFENESMIVLRMHMAPHEKTPMHDITSARLVVWLTDAHLRDIHPDGSTNETHRRAGEIDWVGVQRHAGENLSHEPLEFLAIVPKAGGAAVPK